MLCEIHEAKEELGGGFWVSRTGDSKEGKENGVPFFFITPILSDGGSFSFVAFHSMVALIYTHTSPPPPYPAEVKKDGEEFEDNLLIEQIKMDSKCDWHDCCFVYDLSR